MHALFTLFDLIDSTDLIFQIMFAGLMLGVTGCVILLWGIASAWNNPEPVSAQIEWGIRD